MSLLDHPLYFGPFGNKIETSTGIANHFKQFYFKLYNLPTPLMTDPSQDRKKLIEDFLTQYSPRPISDAEAANLEKPITGKEIIDALKQLKPGKSPGPDGLPTSYYKTFTDMLTPHLLKTFNALLTSPTKHLDILEAHITVIPKHGKDATLVPNYRPISLINVDMKRYAKILANRILPLLPL